MATRRPIPGPWLFLSLALATPPLLHAAEGDEVSTETFLRGWIEGKAELRQDLEFHREFPDSPHKEDSERFEVAGRCYEEREKDAGSLATLGLELMKQLESPGKLSTERARRTIFVLGCLQDTRAVDLLAQIATGAAKDLQDPSIREEAVRALGLFGARNPKFIFSIFGGRLRHVILPARPEPRATRALLEVARAAMASKDPTPELAWAVNYALEFHGGKEVEDYALALVKAEPRFQSFSLLKAQGTPECVQALGKLLGSDPSAFSRESLAYGLGWSASVHAIEPLLGALDDKDPEVREAATISLHRLAGMEDPKEGARQPRGGPEKARAEWRRVFGEKLERFDAAKALRHVEKPGIYQLGPS